MIRDLPERRPGRTGCDIFRAASRAAHAYADLGNGLRRTEWADERFDRYDCVVAASVTPTKYVHPFSVEVTECCRALRTFFPCKRPTLHVAHCQYSPFTHDSNIAEYRT